MTEVGRTLSPAKGHKDSSNVQQERLRLPPNPSSTLLATVTLQQPILQYSSTGAIRAAAQNKHAVDTGAEIADTTFGKPWKQQTGLAQLQHNDAIWNVVSLAPSRLEERRDILRLNKKLQLEVERFNFTWGKREPEIPLIELLMLAAKAAQQLYNDFMEQLAAQVTQHCEERGLLLDKVWSGYCTVIDSILPRLRDQCCDVRGRLDAIKGQKNLTEYTLRDEIDSLKNQIQKLQSAGPSDRRTSRKSLMPSDFVGFSGSPRKSLMPGDFSGFPGAPRKSVMPADLASILGASSPAPARKRSTAVRFKTEEDEAPSEDVSGTANTGVTFSAGQLGGLSGPSNTAEEGEPPSDRQPSGVVETLKSGTRRASMAAGNLLKSLQLVNIDDDNDDDENDESLQAKNEALKASLEACRSELFEVYEQIAQLEAMADEAVALESRAEAAENERDDALERARVYTPRPAPVFASADPPLSAAAVEKLAEALEEFRAWPAEEIAAIVVGESAGTESAMAASSAAFGCLSAALAEEEISYAALLEALQGGTARQLLGSFCTQQQMAFIERQVGAEGHPPDCSLLAAFLTGLSPAGYELPSEFYGSVLLAQPGLSMEKVTEVIRDAMTPTTDRVAALEEENRKLREEVEGYKAAAAAQAEIELRSEQNRRLRDEESHLEKPHPMDVFLDLLAASDEASVKEGLMGMGIGADVPKLFRCSGRVRNKQMSKRETEKMVKEIWKDKLTEMKAGKHTDLVEFVFQHLQKRVGIVTAVVEAGYNLLFGLWKYSFDADCSLFLKILKGDIKEDVYLQQINLKEDLDTLFTTLDKTVHTVETGTVPKADIATALEVYFRVGEPGGKTAERFDALMQALDADQDGPVVFHKKLFEEDREFNQGEFAEAVREQFLEERVEFFRELQRVLYVEALNEDTATREQLVRALCKTDVDLTEKQAWGRVNEVFMPGSERHSIKLLMKRLQASAVKRGRNSSAKLSVISKLGKASGKAGIAAKPKIKASSAVQDAVEAVRLKMLAPSRVGKSPQIAKPMGNEELKTPTEDEPPLLRGLAPILEKALGKALHA